MKSRKEITMTKQKKVRKIDQGTYKARIKMGWSQKDALEISAKGSKRFTDHLGNEYKSMTEMVRAYNILYSKKPKPFKDHFGNEYKCIHDAAKAYGLIP